LQPFYRLENTHQISGTGLGLALVKDIARWHGSQIRLSRSATLGGLAVAVAFTTASSAR